MLQTVPEGSLAAFCMFYPGVLCCFFFFFSLYVKCVGEVICREGREIEFREQGRCQFKDLPLSLDSFGSRNFFGSSAALSTSDVACYMALDVSQSQNFLGAKTETCQLPFSASLTCVFPVL